MTERTESGLEIPDELAEIRDRHRARVDSMRERIIEAAREAGLGPALIAELAESGSAELVAIELGRVTLTVRLVI